MISKTNPLYIKSDLLLKEIYILVNSFPKYEMYGATSQIRRSALSIILNIIEGFARQSPGEYRRFLLISFGSLKETQYLIEFAKDQNYIDEVSYLKTYKLSEEVSKILWSIIHSKN
ncbi:four helix bundle protein [Patescibacteria group bacterium]|nr:four helix bundle protein [Patescibacteria group bacterium]